MKRKSAWLLSFLAPLLATLNTLVPRKDGRDHVAVLPKVRAALLSNDEEIRTDDRIAQLRVDDGETWVLARQLEFVQAEVFDVLFPPPKALEFIPLDTSVPPGATAFVYREMEASGVASIIANYAQDLPRIDAMVRETAQKVVDVGDSYGYSVRDLQQAAYANIALDATKARMAREAIDRKFDEVLAIGNTVHGISGFTNHANVPTLALSNGAWLTTASPDEILEDMNEAVTTVITQSKGVHEPDTMLLPLDMFEHISNTPRSEHSDTTILEFFLRTNRHVKSVEPWFRMDTAGPSSAPRGLVYRKDPSVVRAVVPSLFEQLPPEARNLELRINCLGRIGGTVWYRPMAACYMDGM